MITKKRIRLRNQPGNGPQMNLDGLQLAEPRIVNGRVVVDLLNEDRETVLSGNADHVLDTAWDRGYNIINEQDVCQQLDKLAANAGIR